MKGYSGQAYQPVRLLPKRLEMKSGMRCTEYDALNIARAERHQRLGEHLSTLGITKEHQQRIATEGALLVGLLANSLSRERVIVSDGAGQCAILLHPCAGISIAKLPSWSTVTLDAPNKPECLLIPTVPAL